MSCMNNVGEAAERINKNGANPILSDCGRQLPSFATVDDGTTGIGEIIREVQEFNRVYGIQGRIPVSLELKMAGRADLARTIRVNGGFVKVANCIGLRYVPQGRVSADEWISFQQTLSDVRAFISDNQLDGRMPLFRELRQAGLHQLAMSIIRFGGFDHIASWLGLFYEKHPKQETVVNQVNVTE